MQDPGWRRVIAMAAACLSVAAAVAQDERSVQVSETVIGEMPAGDPGTTMVTYEFLSPRSGRMTIEARSLDFDVALRVWEEARRSDAPPVSEDDNSGVGTDSKVVSRLVRKRRYLIEVRAVRDDWGGALELSVQKGNKSKPLVGPEWKEAQAAYWEEVETRALQRSNEGRGIRALRGRAEALELDDPERAELMNRAVARAEEFFGLEHPNTAQNLDGLALAHEVQGEFDVARPLRERTLAMRERQLGPDHPRTEESRRVLAELGTWRAGFAGVSYPTLIRSTKVLPGYPFRARKLGATGRVILEAIIRRDGAVGAARVLRAPAHDLGFEQAALDAVLQWHYEPAMKDGKPVDIYFTVVVEFTLK